MLDERPQTVSVRRNRPESTSEVIERDSILAVGDECAAFRITFEAASKALMIERHPEWAGQEWIDKGVARLCTEHS